MAGFRGRCCPFEDDYLGYSCPQSPETVMDNNSSDLMAGTDFPSQSKTGEGGLGIVCNGLLAYLSAQGT